jgi:hypothetical protein
MHDVTEVAFVLADLVCDWRAFPDDAARDLHRMLGHRIAAPNVGELRYDRLQLLLTMILDTGVVPTADEYQARRAVDASDAPVASTLIVAYGHWLGACRAAFRFVDREHQYRVPHTHPHGRAYTTYKPREIIDAIVRFHSRFGEWPTRWEFTEWGQIERRAARRAGASDPRIPESKPIRTAFGTYSRALAAAQRTDPRAAHSAR